MKLVLFLPLLVTVAFCQPPDEWVCNPAYWDAGDGCDCACGAEDPDCAGPSGDTVFGCATGQTCTAGECSEPAGSSTGNDQPSSPPPSWTCLQSYYAAGDGCDCGCGAPDPDCSDPSQVTYGCAAGEVCDDGVCAADTGSGPDTSTGSSSGCGVQADYCGNGDVRDCSNVCWDPSLLGWLGDGGCDEGTDGGPNFNCEAYCYDQGDCNTDSGESSSVPAGWTCPEHYYDAGDGCDCLCGVYDPDCDDTRGDIYGCPDGSSCSAEGTCVAGCASNEYQCGNGDCIPSSNRCDGTPQCSDETDEARCGTCVEGEFPCRDLEQCIPETQFCDGSIQCDDESDEAFCEGHERLEKHALFCVGGTRGCDCKKGYLGCWGGTCIPTADYCDGFSHCEAEFTWATDDETFEFCGDTSFFDPDTARTVSVVFTGVFFVCASYFFYKRLHEWQARRKGVAPISVPKVQSAQMMRLYAEKGLEDYGWRDINLAYFVRSTNKLKLLWLVMRVLTAQYAFSFAADALAIKATFDSGQDAFGACYLVIWGLKCYLTYVELVDAKEIIHSGDVSDALTNRESRRYYMVKSFAHFSFMRKLAKAFGIVDNIIISVYTTLHAWKMLVLVNIPHVAIASLVISQNIAKGKAECELSVVQIGADGTTASSDEYQDCIQLKADESFEETVFLGIKIGVSSILLVKLVLCVLLAPCIRCLAFGVQWTTLREYVSYKIDRALNKLVSREVDKTRKEFGPNSAQSPLSPSCLSRIDPESQAPKEPRVITIVQPTQDPHAAVLQTMAQGQQILQQASQRIQVQQVDPHSIETSQAPQAVPEQIILPNGQIATVVQQQPQIVTNGPYAPQILQPPTIVQAQGIATNQPPIQQPPVDV